METRSEHGFMNQGQDSVWLEVQVLDMARHGVQGLVSSDPSHALAAAGHTVVGLHLASSFALSCDVPCSSAGSKR